MKTSNDSLRFEEESYGEAKEKPSDLNPLTIEANYLQVGLPPKKARRSKGARQASAHMTAIHKQIALVSESSEI